MLTVKINKTTILTPLNWFSIVLLIVIMLYSLGWSLLFDELDKTVFFVLFLIIGFSSLFSYFICRGINISGNSSALKIVSWPILTLFYGGFILDLFQHGSIPLLDVLVFRVNYDYKLFHQTPYFSTFYNVIAAYVAILYIRNYLISGGVKNLALALACLLPSIIIINRSISIIVLLIVFFSYLQIKQIKFSKILLIVIIFLVSSFLFGFIGDIREKAKTNNEIVKYKTFNEIAQLSESYPSFLPNEFSWAYIYIVSPLANFNHNVKHNPSPKLDVTGLLIHETLPLSLSFRINKILNKEMRESLYISNYFSASSFFTYAYKYAGFTGVFFIFGLLVLIVYAFYKIAKTTHYYLFDIGLGIVTTFAVLCIYDNMFSFNFIWFLLVVYYSHVIMQLTRNKVK